MLIDIINTLTLPQWLVLAAIPPAILALYFLKLKRQPLVVPSTYLWTRAIEDLHVNSLWQRLRQNLLLYLQLALVVLLMLTLLRPGFEGARLEGDRFVLLIDTSASMNASDEAPTRLDRAKREAVKLIDQMRAGDVGMVISFSNVARVEQNFTSNARQLRQKVELIEPTNRPSDLLEALRAASGLANPGQSGDPNNPNDMKTAEAQAATLYILSDGGFGAVKNFKLGNLTPNYLKIAAEAPRNLGVTAFTTEANPEKPGQVQAFARVENYGESDEKCIAKLFLNGIELDAQNVEVPPLKDSLPGAVGLKFELQAVEQGVLRLELDAKDHLPLDDKAYAVINLPQPAKVLLLTPGNDALELALATDEATKMAAVVIKPPSFLQDKAYAEQAGEGLFDLILYDRCVPKTMPACNTLFIGRLPPEGGWAAKPKAFPTNVRDVNQLHPLTQLVQMENVTIVEGTPLAAPPGSSTLMEAYLGPDGSGGLQPVFAIGPRGGFEDAVLGFEIYGNNEKGETTVNTDWERRRSFPVFVMNCIKYLGGVKSSLAAENTRPGSPIALRTLTPTPKVRVQTPRKDLFEVGREGQNTYLFTRTEELGVYEVREGSGDKVAQQFAVNLYDSRETDLRGKDFDIGNERVSAATGTTVARQELWRWLLLGAVALLLFEWYVYNRRVYL